mgnify:CR=1 FL=1
MSPLGRLGESVRIGSPDARLTRRRGRRELTDGSGREVFWAAEFFSRATRFSGLAR